MGTLTKNTSRQPRICVSMPPSVGPITLATPNVDVTSTSQRSRSFGSGKRSATAANTVPSRMPPPMPCTPRAITSNSMLSAKSAQHGRQREQHDRREQKRLASEQIAEPPEDRNRDDGCEHVRRRDPRVQIEALQIGDDARHRGADDGLVERDQHRDEGDAEHREQRFAKRQALPLRIVNVSERVHDGRGHASCYALACGELLPAFLNRQNILHGRDAAHAFRDRRGLVDLLRVGGMPGERDRAVLRDHIDAVSDRRRLSASPATLSC